MTVLRLADYQRRLRTIPLSWIFALSTGSILILVTICCIVYRSELQRWSEKFSGPLTSPPNDPAGDAAGYDPRNPDLGSKPVDLTKLGAVGDMPPRDHPIYQHQRASEIAPELNKITPESVMFELTKLKERVGSLERAAS